MDSLASDLLYRDSPGSGFLTDVVISGPNSHGREGRDDGDNDGVGGGGIGGGGEGCFFWRPNMKLSTSRVPKTMNEQSMQKSCCPYDDLDFLVVSICLAQLIHVDLLRT